MQVCQVAGGHLDEMMANGELNQLGVGLDLQLLHHPILPGSILRIYSARPA
jgi:hypothetical protein